MHCIIYPSYKASPSITVLPIHMMLCLTWFSKAVPATRTGRIPHSYHRAITTIEVQYTTYNASHACRWSTTVAMCHLCASQPARGAMTDSCATTL